MWILLLVSFDCGLIRLATGFVVLVASRLIACSEIKPDQIKRHSPWSLPEPSGSFSYKPNQIHQKALCAVRPRNERRQKSEQQSCIRPFHKWQRSVEVRICTIAIAAVRSIDRGGRRRPAERRTAGDSPAHCLSVRFNRRLKRAFTQNHLQPDNARQSAAIASSVAQTDAPPRRDILLFLSNQFERPNRRRR